jgi:hypothetical protein
MEGQFAGSYGLEKHGIKNTGSVYWMPSLRSWLACLRKTSRPLRTK